MLKLVSYVTPIYFILITKTTTTTTKKKQKKKKKKKKQLRLRPSKGALFPNSDFQNFNFPCSTKLVP